jgi:hypothetical protein
MYRIAFMLTRKIIKYLIRGHFRPKMEDIRKLLSSYLQKVEGLLGIVLSDRDGVPILRSVLEFSNNLWGLGTE